MLTTKAHPTFSFEQPDFFVFSQKPKPGGNECCPGRHASLKVNPPTPDFTADSGCDWATNRFREATGNFCNSVASNLS
jgi:hypothetical protein